MYICKSREGKHGGGFRAGRQRNGGVFFFFKKKKSIHTGRCESSDTLGGGYKRSGLVGHDQRTADVFVI